MRKITLAILVLAFAMSAFGQTPTLRIVTDDPNLPSDLFYGSSRVTPLRLRPGTNTPITIDDSDFFVFEQYVDFLSRMPDQAGQDYWTSQLTSCSPQPSCLDRRRVAEGGRAATDQRQVRHRRRRRGRQREPR